MKKKTKKKKATAKKSGKISRKSSARRAARKSAPRRRIKARGRKAAGSRRKVGGGRRTVAGNKRKKPAPSSRAAARTAPRVTNRPLRERLPGPEAAGQSGDTEGLSNAEVADSESVKELVEEGQSFEAGIISGVENAKDADKGGVRTRQVPEDDVPQEYLDED